MSVLVVIRHGPTAWSVDRRIQGRTDIPLSPEGRAAVQCWRLPKEIPDGQGGMQDLSDALWLTSPLSRARETADLLAAPFGANPAVDDRLTEIGYGEWEGRLRSEIDREIGVATDPSTRFGLDFASPGGESPRHVQDRLAPLLTDCAASRIATIAICHKGVIRALYARAVGWDMWVKPPHRLQDAAAHVFALTPAGLPSLAAVNIPLERDADA